VKTRNYIVMSALSFFVVISLCIVPNTGSAYAAEENTKKDVNVPQAAADVNAPKPEILKTEQEKVSYIIGTQIARNFKAQDVEVDLNALMLGLKDALEGKTLAMSQSEMQQVYTRFQQEMRAKIAAKRAEEAAKNLAAGKAFLEENKTKEGVKVLPDGLQYKIITEGTGPTPTADDRVETNYRGTLIDGTEFDSSYKRNKPAEFAVKGVIKGWTEALQLMKVGAKWELYIPADLAYGERGRPGIPPNSTLIFEIELLKIVEPTQAAKPTTPAAKPAQAAKPNVEVK
jgi:FKBP-type peptidyl-prolyl cis-trans isomerase FklB